MIRAAALLLLVAVDPWSASELRALAASDDVSSVPHLERALASSLSSVANFRENLAPPDLEEELVEALLGLERLEPRRALIWCRRILEIQSITRAAWAARQVLARSGEVTVVHTALREYFRAPEPWKRVLGEASRGTGDVRLRAFLSFTEAPRPPSEKLLRSRLERALGRALPPEDVAGPPLVGRWDDVLSIHDHVLSLQAAERFRAIRILARRDDRALLGLPMDAETIGRLSPYLARSQYRSLRERVRRAGSHRGIALASLLFSPIPEDEARRHAEAMRDAWTDAFLANREVIDRLTEVVGQDELVRWIENTQSVEALARVPLPAARTRLEEIGTPRAVIALGERPDTVLSIRALSSLRRSPDEALRFAAESTLLRLGAPGSTAFLRGQLGRPTPDSLLPSVMAASLDPELTRKAIGREGADAFVAMSQFHERNPQEFLRWLSSPDEDLRERAKLVMALVGDERRLPLLIDLAVGEGSWPSRAAAFRALSELELGSFERRLHRLAGHHERRVRFGAAAALVPTGQAWALRLLLAELDMKDPAELLHARRVIARLEHEDAEGMLRAMVADGTAGPFAIDIYLDLLDDVELSRECGRLWDILAPYVAAEDRTALLDAARLSHPQANAAVRRFLGGSQVP